MRWSLVVMLVCACGNDSGGGGGTDAGSADASEAGGAAPTQQEIDSACLSISVCLPSEGVNDCLTDIAPGLAFSTIECLVAAGTDCAAVKACWPYEYAVVSSCSAASMCVGNDAIECSGTVQQITHCGHPDTLGPTCVIANGRAQCAVSTCSADSVTCVGDTVQQCEASRGVLRERDCSARGQTCTNGRCTDAGGGGACATTGPGTCVGTSIVRCSSGVEVHTDCPGQIEGSSCQSVTTPYPDTFCGFGDACYPEKGGETCNGTVLTYCSSGVVATIDCTTLGFTRCQTSTISGGRCAP